MEITYTRKLTNEEAYIAAGMLRDINAERAEMSPPLDAISFNDYAKSAFDPAVDSWLLGHVRKRTAERATNVDARPLAEQLAVLTAVDAKLSELDAADGGK